MSFIDTHDDALRFESAFLLPRGPYKDNSAFLKLSYDWSPETRVKLHYDNAR